MKLPTPKELAKSAFIAQVISGFDEDGGPIVEDEFSFKARWQATKQNKYQSEGAKCDIVGKLFIFESLDKWENILNNNFLLYMVIDNFNNQYEVASFSVKRNPDNSPNHVVVELM